MVDGVLQAGVLPATSPQGRKRFVFHRSYVLDTEAVFGGLKGLRQRKRALERAIRESSSIRYPVEMVELKEERVNYVVPSLVPTFDLVKDLTYVFVRTMFLVEVDQMIKRQRREEETCYLTEKYIQNDT